jgi:hypothetical protein
MWNWAIWGALIAGFLCVLGALAFLAVRVLEAWRVFKRVRRHLFHAIERLTERGTELAEQAAQAADVSEAMEHVARLRRSLARLAVLREAISEAQDTLGRFAAVMPRK